jgi:IS5 family transposase
VAEYSSDSDARFGCKGKEKFWFGYKRHVSVDMSGGLINQVSVTPANAAEWEAVVACLRVVAQAKVVVVAADSVGVMERVVALRVAVVDSRCPRNKKSG